MTVGDIFSRLVRVREALEDGDLPLAAQLLVDLEVDLLREALGRAA